MYDGEPEARNLRVLYVGISEAVNDKAWRLLEERGVTIERLFPFNKAATGQRHVAKLRRYLPSPWVIQRIRDAVTRLKPDLVHIEPGRAVALAVLRALRDRPDLPVAIERGAIGGLNLLSPIEWLTYFNRRITRIIVPSYGQLNAWMGRPFLAAALGAGRVEVVHHSIQTLPISDAAYRDALRTRLGLPRDSFVVGTVCAIRPVKNIAFAARVVAALDRDAVLAIIGGEGDPDTMHEIERAGAGRVRFLGRHPGIATMPAFDVYVTPTRGPGEGFGLATLEAMAVGLPVVATNLGGSGDLLSGVGQALPLSERDWITALEQLARDPALRARIGMASRERAQAAFSPAAIADQTLGVWSRMAGRPS